MRMTVVKLTEEGVQRVLQGRAGMTFLVDKFTPSSQADGREVAHVRDYRFSKDNVRGFQIWSLGPRDYTVVVDHTCNI